MAGSGWQWLCHADHRTPGEAVRRILAGHHFVAFRGVLARVSATPYMIREEGYEGWRVLCMRWQETIYIVEQRTQAALNRMRLEERNRNKGYMLVNGDGGGMPNFEILLAPTTLDIPTAISTSNPMILRRVLSVEKAKSVGQSQYHQSKIYWSDDDGFGSDRRTRGEEIEREAR